MSGTDSGGFRFVSHQRRGLVALPGVADAGTVTAAATLSDGSTTTPVTLKLAGVGDIQALDTTLVTRMYPRPDATDAETEFFPLVEFGATELPWLLPGPHDGRGPLPWLCLVAVEARDGVSVTPAGAGRPDTLHIGDPARPSEELPDPADAALWAHAFVATTVHTEGSADPTELPNGPPLTTCRLLAPRRLEPQKSYLACLVPTLAAAKLAGLGRPDSEIQAALAAAQPNFAWSPTDGSVDLPVYLHWGFSCGEAGDFESLARSLQEVPVGPTFGTRPLDLGLAGAGMPETTSLKTVFRGALTAPGIAAQTEWPDPADADQGSVDTSLTAEIAAAAALTAAAAAAHPAGRPAIGPLLYARAAAGRGDVTTATPAVDWFDQLNRDPRARGVAGLGTRVLRRNVEDLMARAWQQVGEVEAANAALRRLQVSRAVAASLHERHLSALSPGRLMTTARPLLGRVALPAAVTGGAPTSDALAAVADSALPAGTTWRGFGTALRPGSRLGDAAAQQDASGALLTRLVAGIDEPDVLPDGTVALAPPSAVFGEAAASLMSDGVRTAAVAAGLAAPAPDASAATVVAALDTLAAGAGKLSTTASAGLASETGAVVGQRPLPESVSFAALGGVLVSGDVVRAKAQDGPVLVHTLPAHSVTTVIHPEASTPALAEATHPATALVGAAKNLQATTQVPPVGPLTGGVPPFKTTPVVVELTGADPRLQAMRTAYAQAVDRFIRPGTATPAPSAGSLDLAAAKTAILGHLDPKLTVATLASARVPALAGLARPDPVAPVMAGPVFGDPAYLDLVGASHDAFVPGLDSIPPDSVTLVQTNPTFIAAYLAGLNSAFGHELLWRDYPTDERGTYWYSFWGAGPDIRALHTFSGGLADNVTEGTQPLLVLILRGRLLKRYPDADIYAVEASTDTDLPELDAAAITRPLFRDFVDPDITLIGFQLTYEQVVGAAGGNGYWFVIAEHPGQPRFGLTDPDPAVTHPPLPTWDELSWADLGPTAAGATYVPAATPPMSPAGTTRVWAATAADMAAITYQPAVRVAIRATDLLPRRS
jgi:hypothetical protein